MNSKRSNEPKQAVIKINIKGANTENPVEIFES